MSLQITVEGMSCEGCEEAVVEALEGVDGVVAATADRTTDSATVDGEADVDDLIAVVSDAGYTVNA